MNVVYNNIEDDLYQTDESSSLPSVVDSEDTVFPRDLRESQTNFAFSSIDFVKLYKGREGLGLFEPSLPRFPYINSFLGRETCDPKDKHIPIAEVGKDLDEAMEGLTMANCTVSFVEKDKIVFREEYLSLTDRVKVISGGKGVWCDYVGKGMLTCAVMGTLGAPKSRVLFVALRQLSKVDKKGIIAIVPNNFEDKLNWGIAVARAQQRGMLVEMVPVDDSACPEVDSPQVRSLAGMVLYFKIAGAMAEEKKSVFEIYKTLWALSIATISCYIPQGECFRICTKSKTCEENKESASTKEEIICKILDLLLDPKEENSLGFEPESKFILFVNAYSGNWHFLHSIAVEATKQLKQRNINLEQVYAGFYVVSKTLGFSISIMVDIETKILRWLKEYTVCQGWSWPALGTVPKAIPTPYEVSGRGEDISDELAECLSSLINAACSKITLAEEILNKMDTEMEYGSKLCAIVDRIMNELVSSELTTKNLHLMFYKLAEYFYEGFNNNDGIMYGLFFSAASQMFQNNKMKEITKSDWVTTLSNSVLEIEAYFQVEFYDGTLTDILGPICTLLKSVKYEELGANLLKTCIKIAFSQSKVRADLKRKCTPCPQATVYGVYILTKALLESIITNILKQTCEEDMTVQFQNCELIGKYGRSLSLLVCQQEKSFKQKAMKNQMKGTKPRSLHRVLERGDIFTNK